MSNETEIGVYVELYRIPEGKPLIVEATTEARIKVEADAVMVIIDDPDKNQVYRLSLSGNSARLMAALLMQEAGKLSAWAHDNA